ncbi:MAG: NlpC/P60 family protein [Corallococcus sp.]|nr:NlpC/P60 family protein [Corallococcus sp.]
MKKKILSVLLIFMLVAALGLGLCACVEHKHTYEDKYSFDSTGHYHKANCGHDAIDSKKPHEYNDPVYNSQTGMVDYSCKVCDCVKSEYCEHKTLSHVEFSDSTCSKEGTLEHYACTKCGKMFSDAEGKNELTSVTVQKKPHTFPEDWKQTKAPSLDEEGEEEGICEKCKHKETRSVDKLTVKSIMLTKSPDKTEYYTNEQFDPAGMELSVTLSNGEVKKLSGSQPYTYDKTALQKTDTFVTVSYYGATVKVDVTVSASVKMSVSQARAAADATEILLEGYYVGIAESGPTTNREILLKDLTSDDIISVRNVTYGTFPDYGYEYGDRVIIKGTIALDKTSKTATPDKKFLEFSAENGEQSATVISKGNSIKYSKADAVTVGSWSEMQALFQLGKIKGYTYVTLSGNIFINRYTGGSDGVDVYRLHLNKDATALAGIKPDETRSVSLRANVMEQNLGADWKQNLFDEEPSGYPGSAFSGSITAVFTGGNGLYYQLTVLESSFISDVSVDNASVITEVAYAFYRQGTQIQYDQMNSRRNLNPSPEDAASGRTIYLDCSSYVNACYYEAFGVNVLPYPITTKAPQTGNFINYAKDNQSNADVVGYWVNANYTTAKAKADLLSEVKGMLQVGDVLNYRHGVSSGSSGHVYIYVGNDTFLHCTGSSYQYEDTPDFSYDKGTSIEKNEGAIQQINSSVLFEESSNRRYLFCTDGSDKVWSFCLLRPLARGLTPTQQSYKRMSVKGVSVEKTSSVGMYGAVALGKTFDYEIKVNNGNSKAMQGLTLTDKLPSCLEYVTYPEGTTVTGSSLSYTFDVAAKREITIKITVRLKSSATATTFVADETKLNGIAVNAVKNTSSKFTDAQLQKVADLAKQYATEKKTFTNPILMAKTLYKDALNVTLFDYTTVSTVLADVIDTTNKTCKTNTAVSKMLVPDLYGGMDIRSGYTKDNARARIVVEDNLAVGDIIIAEYDGLSSVFVYVGDAMLIRVDSETDYVYKNGIADDPYQNTLVTLISYDRYAVLRPSMMR